MIDLAFRPFELTILFVHTYGRVLTISSGEMMTIILPSSEQQTPFVDFPSGQMEYCKNVHCRQTKTRTG